MIFSRYLLKKRLRSLSGLLPLSFIASLYVVGYTVSSESVRAACQPEARIYHSAAEVCPLKSGAGVDESLPLTTTSGKKVELKSLHKKNKGLVVIFHRGSWCQHATEQLESLKELNPELNSLGYKLVAVSAESPEELKAFQAEHKLGFDLLSDLSLEAATAFGISFQAGQESVQPAPSVFVLDADGGIRFQYTNADFKIRLSDEKLLAALKGIR